METGGTGNVSTGHDSPEYDYVGLLFIIIPLITLLGNLLVIISVLRFRALQSAINFLILGLAVADLLVAIIVMPYAVYLYVTMGVWRLGDLMCDIYNASDVGCSTASILLLAVISFDRYRAVSQPIQYSRQSQNVKRVFAVIAAIWFISLALASPMVLGANVRPENAKNTECRFYNAEFSLLSSMISFIIPCILVLFVYIRIIIALKKREKAAKLRREKNSIAQGLTIRNEQADPVREEQAGRIVAGPEEREFGNSSTPRSSMESLSENVNVVTNDFVSENCTTISRRSSFADESQPTSSQASSGDGGKNHSRRFRSLSRNYSTKQHKRNMRNVSVGSHHDQAFIPSIIRTISRRSPRIFRKNPPKKPSIVLANPNTETPTEYRKAPLETMSISSIANTPELLASPDNGGLITETVLEEEFSQQPPLQPTVSFALTVREMEGDALDCLKGGSSASSRRVSQIDSPLAVKIFTRPSLPSLELQRMDSVGTSCSSKTRADSLKSTDSKCSKKSSRNGIAVKLVKKAIKHEHSLKRKVSKAQRKEKRATKTLGVVVGVFLVCWVPFFVINILNAVCSLLEKDACMVRFEIFFWCTWIGYMNSFMNPIIYTIFNTEFRRAFKSILFGRNSVRSQTFNNKQAHL